MKRNKILGIVGTVVFLCMATFFFGWLYLQRLQPNYSTTVSFPNINDSVLILRNDYAIPTIKAENEYDLFFALGYIHAQDRLWQMDLFRRLGKGQLSEIFGERLLTVDKVMRSLQIEKIAQQILPHIDSSAYQALVAYSDGVNAYMRSESTSPEFHILGYSPTPWKPVDCVVLTKLIAWELNLSYWADFAYSILADSIGVFRTTQLFPPPFSPPYPSVKKTEIPPLQAYLSLSSHPAVKMAHILDSLLQEIRIFPEEWYRYTPLSFSFQNSGSNSWAVKTQNHIFLASDPHLTYFLPPRWYAVQLFSPSIHVAGMSIPGLPFVIIGRNRAIAWGITNMMADDSDFFIEKISRDGKFSLISNSTKQALQIDYDTIFVKDADPVVLPIKKTKNGVLIDEHLFNILHTFPLYRQSRSEDTSEYAIRLALQWSGFHPSDEISTLYRIQKAQNYREFIKALKTYGAPCIYITFADTSGYCSIIPAGIYPLRYGHTYLPRIGWDSTFAWKQFINLSSFSEDVPAQNYAFSANNPLTPNLNNGFYWEPISRAVRIQDILKKGQLDFEDINLMFTDFSSVYARQFIDRLKKKIDSTKLHSLQQKMLLRKLFSWDYLLNPNSETAAIYTIFRYYLTRLIFEDELGGSFALYSFVASIPTRLLPAIFANDSLYQWWIDNKKTLRTETLQEIIRSSLDSTWHYLNTLKHNSTDSVFYGEFHKLRIYHPFGIVPFLSSLVNLGPYSVGGDNTTINHQQWSFLKPFSVIIGPSMRFLTDMKQNKWWCVLPGGQSGFPFSWHYQDQIHLWLFGELIELPFTDNLDSIPHRYFSVLQPRKAE